MSPTNYPPKDPWGHWKSQEPHKHEIENEIVKRSIPDDVPRSAFELADEGFGKITISSDGSMSTIEPLGLGTHGPLSPQSCGFLAQAEENYLHDPQKVDDGNGMKLPDMLYSPSDQQHHHQHFLSWRSDPKTSFSDWTIEVASMRNNRLIRSDVYHCHSNVLVWGPRKCDVLKSLFEDRMKYSPPPSTTQIDLTPPEAQFFPILLDFLYCEKRFTLTVESACSLYALADTFKVRSLQSAIRSFVEEQLDIEQCIDLLKCARQHALEENLGNFILFMNSKICNDLVRNPEEASQAPPELLADILHRRAQVLAALKRDNPSKYSIDWENERSKKLSVVVAQSCYSAIDMGTDELDRNIFEQLVQHLPALDGQAAMSLLMVETSLQDKENISDGPLTSFQQLCVNSSAMDWDNILEMNDQRSFYGILASMDAKILAELLLSVSQQYRCKRGRDAAADQLRPLSQLPNMNNAGSLDNHSFTVNSKADSDLKATVVSSLPGYRGGLQASLSNDSWDDDKSLEYSRDRYGIPND